MTGGTIDFETRPGFRRRILILPEPGRVCAELEDDYHRMSVELLHGDGTVVRVRGEMQRWPWSTCPGAIERLERTFAGRPLDNVAASDQKFQNCTHLYDLTLFAARNAGSDAFIAYDTLVTDSVNGVSEAILHRNGEPSLHWKLEKHVFVDPPTLAGRRLSELRDWIAALDASVAESARILRWAVMIARGRRIEIPAVASESRLRSGVCHTFQPHVASHALHRTASIIDFSDVNAQPLAERAQFFRPTARGRVG